MVSTNVTRFVESARLFSDFIRVAETLSLGERLQAREVLLQLYSAGALLPQVEPPEGVEAGPTPEVPVGWKGFEDFGSLRPV